MLDFDEFKACMKKNNKFDAVASNVTGHARGKISPVPAYEKTWKNVVKMAPGNVNNRCEVQFGGE